MHHQLDHADLDHDGARLRQSLIVFAVATIPPYPSERTFHHPRLGRSTNPWLPFGRLTTSIVNRAFSVNHSSRS